jgi:hypothetical protein
MIESIIGAAGSLLGGLFGDDDAKKNRALQREFAQNQIRWKVADAKAAGLHPLAALGATSTPYNPVSSPMGQAVSDAASQLGRATSAAYEKELRAKNLENIDADIALKQAQTIGYIEEAKRASNLALNSAPGTPKIMPKYIEVYNRFTGKTEFMPNPDMGVEFPETYGAALLSNATMQDIRKSNKSVKRSSSKRGGYSSRNPNPRARRRYYGK